MASAQDKLGPTELLAIGVGGMIGGGIFSVLGIAVGSVATRRPGSRPVIVIAAIVRLAPTPGS